MRLHARKRWARQVSRRELHLVDPENLVGTGAMTAEEVAAVMAVYREATGIATDAQIVFGTSSWEGDCAARFGWGHRPGRFVRALGPSGAERALLAEVGAGPAVPFGRVVIGSGDGIFALVANRLRAAGTRVVVVSWRSALSRTLAAIADEVVYLDDWFDPKLAAALRPALGIAA